MEKQIIDMLEKSNKIDLEEIVIRHHQQYDMPIEEIYPLLLELKKWLILCAVNPKSEYMLMGKVDKLWHTFILFTKKYAEFCEIVAGRFIHHQPEINPFKDNILKTKKDLQALDANAEVRTLPNNTVVTVQVRDYKDDVVAGYKRFLEDYQFHFQDDPDTAIWPRILPDGRAECESGCCAGGGGGSCGCGPTSPPPHHDN